MLDFYSSKSMRAYRLSHLAVIAFIGLIGSDLVAQEIIQSGTYTQNFNSISSGLPSGWSGRTGATASALGGSQPLTVAPTDWASFSGQYANYASNNIPSDSDVPTQAADADRAFGLRQTSAFGNVGAAFTFNFSTINTNVESFGFDLMTLSNQPRVTVWTIQYGIGVSPTSFTDLGTYTTGTFASTSFSFTLATNEADLLLMSNQASVWFRVVGLIPTTESGNRDTTGIDNFVMVASEASGGSELYWDAGEWVSAAPGGAGDGSWADGQGNWEADNKAIFAAAGGGTVSLGSVTANAGLQFSASGYTLQDGFLELGAPLVSIEAGVTATIASVITGSNGLTLVDGGTLTLTGTNTFTGNITLSASTLAIGADENLGGSDNDIVLSGGGLSVAGDVALGSGRDLSGAGSLDVGAGTTLTVNGAVNAGLTLSNSGTVVLAGFSNTLTALSFSAAGSLVAPNAVNIGGSVTTTHTAGTARIVGNAELGNTLRAFSVADGSADVDLEIIGNLTGGGSARIHKLGAGTLRMDGDNSGLLGGFRLGTANGPTGGRIIAVNNTSLGAGVFQFNHGTLFAENAVDFSIAASIGGLNSAPAIIEGANVSFTGSSSFFTTVGQRNALKVNNTTTFNGQFTHTGTAGTGLDVGGAGTLIINADATGFLGTTNVQDTVKMVVNNTWTADISVDSTASFGGIGSILGTVTVAGNLTPGDGVAGILTAGNLTLDSTAVTTMLLQGSGLRGVDYSAVNTTGLLSYGGALVLSLSGGDYSLAADLFDFASAFGGFASIDLMGAYGTVSLTDADVDGVWTASTVTTNFTFNANDGTFVLAPVPEPSTMAFLALGLGLMGFRAVRIIRGRKYICKLE